MSLVIEPNNISYSLIKNRMLNYVRSKPDGEAWKDFFSSSAGTVLIELLAGSSSFLTYNGILSRRETYLNYARDRSSGIGVAENLSYNVKRGSNIHVQLLVVSDEVVTINKWDVVGTVNEYQLISWQTLTLFPSTPVLIECVVGNLITNVTYDITSSNTDVFRMVVNNVSDDVRLLYRKSSTDNYIDLDKEDSISTNLLDLLEDKYVLLTNPYDSVDIYYLNNKPSLLNVGDEVRLLTSGILPSPLKQNTPYYVIPRGENLISLSSVEIDAYNDNPVDLTSVGSGLHLINSTYSFNVDGIESNSVSPSGLSSNVLAVNGIYPKYRYDNGTILRLDYIELKDITFNLTDIEFFYGTIQHNDSRTKIIKPYNAPESLGSVKVNAPLFFETQFVIKGRNDFKKILKRLDSRFIDTNSRDLSPATVEVTYLKEDLSLLTKEERLIHKTNLNAHRPFGVSPADIVDPVGVNYSLNINLLLRSGVTVPVLQQELRNVLSFEPDENGIVKFREKKLGYSLLMYQLEHDINNLLNTDGQKYIQISRVSISTSDYSTSTLYKRGDFVVHSSNTDYMFECIGTIGRSLIPFTTDFCSIYTPTYLTTSYPHSLVTGQVVKIFREGDGDLPNPLSDSAIYYVIYRATNQISLSLTPDGQDIRLLNNGSGNSGINNIVSGFVFTTDYVNEPTHLVITNHGLQNDETVNVYSDKDLPIPLLENTVYYVNVIDSNTIELKESLDGDAIVLEDNGTFGSTKTLHTAVGQGMSDSTLPSFSSVVSEGEIIIDNEILWRSKLKTSVTFDLAWNEYLLLDFDFQTSL